MMRYVEHNFNNRVKVKLTEIGQNIMKEHYSKKSVYDAPVKVDTEGYTSFQTYEFMSIFGNFISLGRAMPFDSQVLFETSEE